MNGCKKKYVVFIFLGIAMAALGGALFPLGDYVIRKEIIKKVTISNTSEVYEIWQDIPIPVYMQFWLFNVENADEVLEGKKPYLKQKGPYTYRERRTKFDIVWHENGTVTYKQNKTFHFVREMSVGSESDKIHTINPFLATSIQSFRWLPPYVKTALSLVISASGADGLFIRRNVSELLWGYDDPTLKILNKIIPLWFNETQVGFFIRKNYTHDGVYTIGTGAKNIDDLGDILAFNGKKYVDIWTTPWANMVNGTDGSVGPPFRFDNQDSPIFVSDLCRSIKGVYSEDVKSPQGIKLRRFAGDRYDMANATVNPNNLGFCTPQTKCLPTGLLNSTLCQIPVDRFMIPLIFSFPHFLFADPAVQDSVLNLSPNQDEHQTELDIEPWTGLVMQVAKRVQINFYVEQVPDILQTRNISKLFFPILWINESVVVDDKRASMVQDELFLPMNILNGLKIGLIVVGGMLAFVTFTFFLARRDQRAEKTLTATQRQASSNGPTPLYDDPDPATVSKQVTDNSDDDLLDPEEVRDNTQLISPSSAR